MLGSPLLFKSAFSLRGDLLAAPIVCNSLNSPAGSQKHRLPWMLHFPPEISQWASEVFLTRASRVLGWGSRAGITV